MSHEKDVLGEVCRIISEMLDNPDEDGIYNTSKAYAELVSLIRGCQIEAMGWMFADACVMAEKGIDIRQASCVEILERAMNTMLKMPDVDRRRMNPYLYFRGNENDREIHPLPPREEGTQESREASTDDGEGEERTSPDRG